MSPRSSAWHPEPLETVEDQVEPELELAGLIRIRVLDVLLSVLDDVGVLVDGRLAEEGLGKVHEHLARVEGRAST
jgi:hypothetical protein